jgi:predicted ribosomally synthesized peptide with SipW-like signal peptide
MNRKIVMSLGVVVFVAALSWGATGAFFSDSETSTGNTFTAGAIDLTVDSQQHYNRMVCTLVGETYSWQPEVGFTPGVGHYPATGTACDGTWTMTNLGPTHQFFDFDDVKPGDEGENTISLHIDSNPAWACADVTLTKNDDVSTVDPETDAGDVVEDVGNMFDGELAQNLWFTAWPDVATTSGGIPGDNIWQGPVLEPLYFAPGPAFNVLNGTTTLALADSLGGTPLPGGATTYVGLQWCAGTMTVVGNTLVCNGATMGNIAQTDSMVGNITLRVEQHRNNPNFLCTPRVVTEPTTGTITVNKSVSFTSDLIAGVDVNDFTLHLIGPSGDIVVTDEVASGPLLPGAYTVSEVYSNDPTGVVWDAQFTLDCSDNGQTGTVNLGAGQNLTCNLNNAVSVEAPQIIQQGQGE